MKRHQPVDNHSQSKASSSEVKKIKGQISVKDQLVSLNPKQDNASRHAHFNEKENEISSAPISRQSERLKSKRKITKKHNTLLKNKTKFETTSKIKKSATPTAKDGNHLKNLVDIKDEMENIPPLETNELNNSDLNNVVNSTEDKLVSMREPNHIQGSITDKDFPPILPVELVEQSNSDILQTESSSNAFVDELLGKPKRINEIVDQSLNVDIECRSIQNATCTVLCKCNTQLSSATLPVDLQSLNNLVEQLNMPNSTITSSDQTSFDYESNCRLYQNATLTALGEPESTLENIVNVDEEIDRHQHKHPHPFNAHTEEAMILVTNIYKEVKEIKAFQSAMETTIQKNFDLLMEKISRNQTVENKIPSSHTQVKRAERIVPIVKTKFNAKTEHERKQVEDTHITENNYVQSVIVEEPTQMITNVVDEYNEVTAQVEYENINVESESESESDEEGINVNSVADRKNAIPFGSVSQVQSDPNSNFNVDSESDPESITEPLPTRPKSSSQSIKLSLVGDNFYDEQGFLYSKNNVSPNGLYLRCKNYVKHECPARAIVKDGDLENAVLTTGHSHTSKKKFFIKLDENCRIDPFEKPQKLYLNTKDQIRDEVDEGNLPLLKNCSTFIRNRIQEYVPELPKTIKEFEAFVSQERYKKRFAVDARNLPFLRGVWTSTKGERSIVFISESVLKMLNTLNNVALFMDGTFKALPYHIKFGQLYVINLIYKDHCYPLAYILMEKRTFTAYDAVFTNLKLVMPSVDVVKLMTDYEPATRKALRINYPNAKLSGCFFHYVQAIYKNAKTFGLRTDAKFKQAIQEVAALALLPNEFVEPGFNLIDQRFQRKKSHRWNKFRIYWKKQWAPANISVYGLVDRTNNFSESSNKTLNSLLKSLQPTIWELIHTLRSIEGDKSGELDKLSEGLMLPKSKNLDMSRLDQKIRMATKLFEQTQDIGSFLQNVTYEEDFEMFIKDRVDFDADDELAEGIVPNALNIESDFRQRHPRTAVPS